MGGFFAVPYFMDISQSVPFIISQVCLYAFVFCVVISRVGLWTFDLAETQIMQLGISEDERGVVNTSENSLTNVAEFAVLIATLLVARPEFFIILVLISIGCVQIAAIMYTLWARSKKRLLIEEAEEAEKQGEHEELGEEMNEVLGDAEESKEEEEL